MFTVGYNVDEIPLNENSQLVIKEATFLAITVYSLKRYTNEKAEQNKQKP